MNEMLKRTLEEFAIGETAVFSRTFTEADVALFAGVTWAVNPYHSDEAFCKTHRVGRRIVPGMLVGSLLTHIGGVAAILASDLAFEFLKPVYIGDTITATCTVEEADARRGWARVAMVCTNQENKVVAQGTVRGFPARYKDRVRSGEDK